MLCFTVCTCTLWVGHLPKNVKYQQIKEAFEDYGQVESVDVSCSFVARGGNMCCAVRDSWDV